MNRDIVWTNQFKKDYKLALKRHLDIELLDNIIRSLSRGETLPERNKDHALTGNWVGCRKCIFSRIDFWCIALRMMFCYLRWSVPEPTPICLENRLRQIGI